MQRVLLNLRKAWGLKAQKLARTNTCQVIRLIFPKLRNNLQQRDRALH